MTYFCLIESTILNVPHMEPMLARSDEEAMQEAADLMDLHASAIVAHVFKGEVKIGTLAPTGTPTNLTSLSGLDGAPD